MRGKGRSALLVAGSTKEAAGEVTRRTSSVEARGRRRDRIIKRMLPPLILASRAPAGAVVVSSLCAEEEHRNFPKRLACDSYWLHLLKWPCTEWGALDLILSKRSNRNCGGQPRHLSRHHLQ